MNVTKRSGEREPFRLGAITNRLFNLFPELPDHHQIALDVESSLYDNIPTHEIDSITAEIAIAMTTKHLDYGVLASRIIASNIQKITPSKFSDAMSNNTNITPEIWNIISTNREYFDKSIYAERDFDFDFFGLRTMEKGYLHRVDGVIIETPQYMFMRVSIGIHGDNIVKAVDTYNYMSSKQFIHATPTLFNSGMKCPQMSSCFLVAMKSDSITGIYDTLKHCAEISKWAGGIGMHLHDIRSKASVIKGTNGVSQGIVPMLRVFNATAKYVNQSGKRKGSIAVYIEPWHGDIMEFLELRLNQGDEDARTRDLFTAMWIPDLFMERVSNQGTWSLFSPSTAPGLADVYGDEFEELYTRYEREGRAISTMPASKVWIAILKSQTETGTPYMMYKDSCNKKSNQKNVGVIKSSNLCTEIVEYSDENETAVCNLASVSLPSCIVNGEFSYSKLYTTVDIMTRNLNVVIDRTYYPVPEAFVSNKRHRPIGIGVQGLADVFNLCGYAFDSDEARSMNIAIFETIYHSALNTSMELAKVDGSYSSFDGSPASKGILQFDMWTNPKFSGKYDWSIIKSDIIKHGLRNSLLVAPMPTASTSQILGNNECIEPYTTNIYLRRTLAGEFVVVNTHLINALQSRGLWSKKIKDMMIRDGGSVQNIDVIPPDIKKQFKTVWEISQKTLIDMARDRGCFIDQSQSLNLFMENPTISKLSSMHMYSWRSGLKTGIYYLRSKAKARPIQVTLEPCETCSA